MSAVQEATTAPTQFDWNDAFLLGYAPIDEVHREFVELVAQLLRSSDEDMLHNMDAFIEHAKAHFGSEDTMMNETEFPARECHIDEHAAVMKSAYEVRALIAVGNADWGRSLAQELVRWFPGHADYLDSALAQWMCKREFGGKPIVLRRNFDSPAPPSA